VPRKPHVAIVGRTNVGKSTLFNCLVGRRQAVVETVPGVTRDRLYETAEHDGREFVAIDTGGIAGGESDPLLAQVTEHAEIAIQEADALIFLVDGQEGLTSLDHDIADLVRKSGKPYFLAANKLESPKLSGESFLDLRLGQPHEISALRDIGVDDLLDDLVAALPPAEPDEEGAEDDTIRIAVVGRPNVGKSALVNAIVGQQRVIVSELPGTTRDAIDVAMRWQDRDFVLIDTAGLRRKARVKQSLEYYCVVRALRAIDRADVALLVTDASEGVAEQDAKIGGYAHEAGTASVIVANKWDLIRDSVRERAEELEDEGRLRRTSVRRMNRVVRRDFETAARGVLSFMDYAPIVFTSALKGTGIDDALAAAYAAAQEHARRISTGELNRLVLRAVSSHNPPSRKGRQLRIYYATQVKARPPTIVLFVNDPGLMHWSYERYLIRFLRRNCGFVGTPLKLFVRARERQARSRRSGRRKKTRT
jgi:GTP-binding protein